MHFKTFLRKSRMLPILSGLIFALIFVLVAPVSGQDPSGQPESIDIQPLEDKPVLGVGEEGEWDEVSIRFPHVIYHDDQYHMFYTVYSSSQAPQSIGYAYSDDGISWEKHPDNPIFEGSGNEGSFDGFGVNGAAVMVDEDGTWVLYYNGNPEPGLPPFGSGIGRATAESPEGPWERSEEPVLEAGTMDWEGIFIFPNSVLQTEDGYALYYSTNRGGKGLQGMATSENGITWEKVEEPVLEPDSDSWDSILAWGATVRQTENGWEMFYSGGAPSIFGVGLGYAYSEDGMTWNRLDEPVVLLDDHNILFPAFELIDGQYMVYYGLTATDGDPLTEAHLATGTITFE